MHDVRNPARWARAGLGVIFMAVLACSTQAVAEGEAKTGQPKPVPKPSAPPITNSIGMELVLIPGGQLTMGNEQTPEETADALAAYGAKPEWFRDERPARPVRITSGFYLAVHEVTVGQFRKFADATGYETDAEREGKGWGYSAAERMVALKPGFSWRSPGFAQTDDHPVVSVSWSDAQEFCKWLSAKEGKACRLPTEAEWESACRAGTDTRYYFGDDPGKLPEAANVADASLVEQLPKTENAIPADDGYAFTSPVGQFKPNAFGLYDMHGNVWEWCADWYGERYYAVAPRVDPTGPDSGTYRVLRGGAWLSSPAVCRSATRYRGLPYHHYIVIGFRVAMTP